MFTLPYRRVQSEILNERYQIGIKINNNIVEKYYLPTFYRQTHIPTKK